MCITVVSCCDCIGFFGFLNLLNIMLIIVVFPNGVKRYNDYIVELSCYELNVPWVISNSNLDMGMCQDCISCAVYGCFIGTVSYSWKYHNKTNITPLMAHDRWKKYDTVNISVYEDIMRNYIGTIGTGSYSTKTDIFYPDNKEYYSVESHKNETKLMCIVLACFSSMLLILAMLFNYKWLRKYFCSNRQVDENTPLLTP